MQLSEKQVASLIAQVARPGRYTGSEWNAAVKPWEEARARMAFAFPDVYEVGMSHLGLQILYGLVNEKSPFLMERVFAPWPDMEGRLREKGLPLFSLESRRALAAFEVVGFTLQYEMSYTNVLNMLDLGGIPLCSRERGNRDPLVIAGGPGAFNPEPLADFLDAFVLGEGEEVLLEVLETVAEHTAGLTGARPCFKDRRRLLQELARIPGVYVPALYEVDYYPDGRVKEVRPRFPGVPRRVVRRVVKDLNAAYFPLRPVVPFLEAVHDRIMLEVFRGCQRGCRFCQAGMIYRPVRERSLEVLLRQAENLVRSTGYDEMSLTSLSTGDYSRIGELVRELLNAYREQGIAVSLPSLRIDTFSVGLAEEVQKGRKTGLTFAPEAGTQRLRDVINKGVRKEDLLAAAKAAFAAGWPSVKLYFMIGLPTEREEDLDGIVDLARAAAALGSEAGGKKGGRRPEVTVSVSNFVPKPHTPFQWEGQNPVAELKRKQEYLRSKLRDRRIKYDWHDAELSFLEAAIARGDRRLGAVLKAAWQKGCRFDGWSEFFRPQRWKEAFAEQKLEAEFYACRFIPYEEVLPWDHLDSGVSREFLVEEHRKAMQGLLTEDCRFAFCTGCGVCPALDVEPVLCRGTGGKSEGGELSREGEGLK